jgi:hypothetical protein
MIRLVLATFGLTVATVVIHGLGGAAATRRVAEAWEAQRGRPSRLVTEFLVAQLVGTLLLLHLVEATVWALFFGLIGGMPSLESALYFSLASYTTVGYGDVVLSGPWRLLGPIEAAVGVLMLGWSTGILVTVIGMMYRELFPVLRGRTGGTPGAPAK